MDKISLSNITVKRRIDDMAQDIENQLLKMLNAVPFFALQCDETTDVSQSCQLLFYCRFIFENKIIEEMLFSKELSETSKGIDIFAALSKFLEENQILWMKVIGICTDGAPAMIGTKSGFLQLVKSKNPSVVTIHCLIHRQALASKTLPDDFNQGIVNFVKTSPLRTRVFECLCSELSAEHTRLLFHTEVRWLSKGNMLARFFELRSEIEDFLLSQSKQELYKHFFDQDFIFILAYLVDFF